MEDPTGSREFRLRLVDIGTDKTIQTYNSSPMSAMHSQISPDGERIIMPYMQGAELIDLATGTMTHQAWRVPAMSDVAVGRDLDTVAFAQAGVAVVSTISNPAATQTIGDAGSMARMNEAWQSELNKGEISGTKGKSQSGSGANGGGSGKPEEGKTFKQALANAAGALVGDPIGARWRDDDALKIMKQCAEQAKQFKKAQDRTDAYNECYKRQITDPERAKFQEQMWNEGEKSFEAFSTFGGPITIPPLTLSIDSGRLLAILGADFSWGFWDAATGNRLPYRRAFDHRAVSSNEAAWSWLINSLHETEREFGATTKTELEFRRNEPPPPRAISRDSEQYYTYFPHKSRFAYETSATANYEFDAGVHVWDAASNEPLFDIPDALSSIPLAVPAGGKVLVGPDLSHALGIWDRKTGECLGTLYALQEGEWVITTPSGLFDGSPRGWSKIGWHEPNGGVSTLPSEAFFNEFYRPGLLAELLEGHKPALTRTIEQVDRRQPHVALSTDTLKSDQRAAAVHLELAEAASGAGLRDARLFRNGILVKYWRGDFTLRDGKAALDATIPLVAGENRLVAYAFNHDNVKSEDAMLRIECSAPAKRGVAYIVSVGVNKYSNSQFDLRFAAPDAVHLAQTLSDSESALGDFRQVVQVSLLDQDATRANLLLALSILAGRTTTQPLRIAPRSSPRCTLRSPKTRSRSISRATDWHGETIYI
jgi:hypothetical protein